MQLDGALLYVKDLPRLVDFYAGLLGARPNESTRTDAWAEFALGSSMLGLHAIPAEIAATIEIGDPPEVREDTPIKLLLSLPAGADLDAALTRIEALGATVLRRPWGGADVVDPEGNVVGLRAAG